MDDQKLFELEVLKIANHLWPEDFSGGSEIIDGKERDGVFITEETVHLVECTVSKTKDKADKDVGKLVALANKMQKTYPDKGVKCWFVTKHEPTADQRTVANKAGYTVNICSYDRFQSRLIDVWEYLKCRNDYPFGSARNLQTGDFKIQEEYIDVSLNPLKNTTQSATIEKLAESAKDGHKIIIQGYYGVGKSMALKEIFKTLSKQYREKQTFKFPIYINLRDHHGQTNPVEVLERHARSIGFKYPFHLVRAWRAGYAILILDGFDEIAAFGWAGKTSTLKDVRYKSVEVVREFFRQNPQKSSIIIAGRINYFDSIKECENAFGTSTGLQYQIGDFTDTQISEYLKKKGIVTTIPNWIPARPLLIGYLAANSILANLIEASHSSTASEGWDFLITEICKREAAIEAGLLPETVREIIEGIASFARKFQSGLGPIFQVDLERVFIDKCGYPPDERALVLLQRLPGLGSPDQQDGSRYFIDEQYVDVSKAGEVYRWINNPYQYKMSSDPRQWQECLSEIGIEMLCHKVSDLNGGIMEEAIFHASRLEFQVLSSDILLALNYAEKSWTRENITFTDLIIPSFELKQGVNLSRLRFRDVFFKELILEANNCNSTSPIFENCYIGKVIGCANVLALPEKIKNGNTIDSFESQETTTTAILSLNMPISGKVGLTILKKLYIQAGAGRQENAFYRGLSPNEQSYVPAILEYLKQNNLAIPSKKTNTNGVWQPVKSRYSEIRNILVNKLYKSPLIEALNKVSV
jgi:hypothetical protein